MKMSYCIIIMGVSGCGKTTIGKLLAADKQFAFVDGDEFHPDANIAKMKKEIPLTDADRRDWLINMIRQANKRPRETGLVLACSALKMSYRNTLRKGIKSLRFVYLKGSYETIYRQLARRKGHFMPVNLLKSQFETLEPPTPEETDVITIDIEEGASETADAVIKALGYTR